MQKKLAHTLMIMGVFLLSAVLLSSCDRSQQDDGGEGETEDTAAELDPWALPPPPSSSVYSGPLFELSHAYPQSAVAPPNPTPWQTAIGGGEINTGNAEAYTLALKDYVAEDMQVLLFDYDNWDAAARGWYNQPWLTSLDTTNQPGILREAIHGTYVGSTFPPDMFPISGLQDTMTTHVVVYYDPVAAWSMQQVWGASGMDPVPGLEAGGGQFPEGGIIVKPATTTATASNWVPMEGAFQWPIYALPGDQSSGDPELMNVSVFQFDIIVKDTIAAPKTGWVFTTLIYDKSVDGDDWDKLVPLGAMWGNDPTVISPEGCDYLDSTAPNACPALSETWINEQTPVYARETLGWGGRLSGPNDGAVDIDAAIKTASGSEPYNGRYAMSSCMSCHSSAEYEMQSFLLPVPSQCADDSCAPTVEGGRLVYYQAGSTEFLNWFQDRSGDVAMNSPQIPLDYGMNYAFKALPQWFTETAQSDTKKQLNFVTGFNDYRGRTIDR